MRILLILPRDTTYRQDGFFRRSLSYAPLTLTTLAALVPPELNAQITVADEGVQAPVVPGPGYDVVGITCVTAAAPRAYALAEAFRARGARVALGGAHPSLNPEEARAHATAVVTGPAEEAWPALLREWAAGREAAPVWRGTLQAAGSAPVPRRDLEARRAYLPIPTVLATRGCCNRCTFCTIGHLWQGQACPRPVGEVVEEIRALRARRILFLDPNLVADEACARELFEALIPLRCRWGGLATVDLVERPGLLDLAARSGCVGILVGFESTDGDSLRACGKPVRDAARYREAIRRLHERDIGVLGCFVFGFDPDDETVFARTLQFIDDTQLDLPRFSVLTPFPGTTLFERLQAEGRILSRDWSLYDTEHVVFQPARMSPAALQQGLFRAWQAAYALPRVARRIARAGRQWPLAAASNFGFRHFAARTVARGGGSP